MSNESSKHTVKINFANQKAAMHFISWLCESGEQSYWEWMEWREDEEEGNITAFSFDYFRGSKIFAETLEVDTKCGRIDAGYKAV